MESYEGQLWINGMFMSIRPSGREEPYRYKTDLEARQMVKSCYPDITCLNNKMINVKKVPFEANM